MWQELGGEVGLEVIEDEEVEEQEEDLEVKKIFEEAKNQAQADNERYVHK